MLKAFKHKDFDWSRFEQKLENFSSLLKNQGSTLDFLVNIEKLYNHKTPINKTPMSGMIAENATK